jgi:hypothetical protein
MEISARFSEARCLLLFHRAHMRWQGDFSPGDEKNWTPELKAALKYDSEAEKELDDGVFWISWEAVLFFFSNIHARCVLIG